MINSTVIKKIKLFDMFSKLYMKEKGSISGLNKFKTLL